MYRNPFTVEELTGRIDSVRSLLAELRLDAAVLSVPESVFYLTGLDHWGYFAPHLLVVPLDGEPVLVTRAMERVVVANQLRTAAFRGHLDDETAADETARVLADRGLAGGHIGLEYWSWGFCHGLAESLKAQVDATWEDISGLVDGLRAVKSPAEQALMRAAAKVTDAATAAAVAAICDGAAEREVAAECLAAMTRAGGDPPGFGPFIRPFHRLGEEHTTWGDGRFARGEPAFLEICGCVGRYNTPNGRLVHIGEMPEANARMADVCQRAFAAVIAALKPGTTAGAVYDAWQAVVDDAGLGHYRRHHCGYLVGVSFPPTWTGANKVVGLRAGSDMGIEAGMSFHIMSWLMGTGQGDFFLSDCVLLGPQGPEVLTTTPAVAVR
ncbi:MAG: aminopeptidase P family protein [Rhodospirillaceae bacterium]|nr:aminopeptidase P family protein [Rhodospirillaceae bacterium]